MNNLMDTSQWITFFSKAGLPPNVAANYALIFSDNRIQLDMLMDLSKEYLYDMGIKVMGDVIAILRFAKEFHTQLAKERAIASTTTMQNKSAVVGRMVGHYTKSLTASSNRTPIMPKEKRLLSNTRPTSKPNVISLKRSSNSQVSPSKKIRRVPPEEEGAYKIKMPLGITEKTRKILQQQQQQTQGSKRSVFSRLGDSAVSSSTDSNKPNSYSVFERLGPSNKSNCDDVPTSTVINEIEGPKRKCPPLQYQGVLKMTVGKERTVYTSLPVKRNTSVRTVIKPGCSLQGITKTVGLNRINAILQSNKPSTNLFPEKTVKHTGSRGIFDRFTATESGVKGRLGSKISNWNSTRTNVMMRTKKVPAKVTSNVFDRLGK